MFCTGSLRATLCNLGFPRRAAAIAATPEALTQQVIQLGNDLKKAYDMINNLSDQVKQLTTTGGGKKQDEMIFDRKKLVPEPYKQGDPFGEWRDEFQDYVEDACAPMAQELKRAARYPHEIDGVHGTPEEIKMARHVFSALRRLMKAPEAKILSKPRQVRTSTSRGGDFILNSTRRPPALRLRR